MADKTGYIGRNPGDSSVIIARQTYEPTGSTSDFTFTSGYTVGLVDVFLNGSKLVSANDYTATGGSIVSLTTAAQNGDIVEIVAYKAFNLGQVSTASGNFSVGGDLTAVNITSSDTVTAVDVNVSGATTAAYITASNLTGARVAFAHTTGGYFADDAGFTYDADKNTLHVENVSIAGTITAEDKTNVDSVGLITARTGIVVNTNGILVSAGVVTATSGFVGNITGNVTGNVTGVATGLSGNPAITVGTITGTDGANITGVTTAVGGLHITTNGITVTAGICTFPANSTVGGKVPASTGKAIAMAMVFG